MQTITKTEQNFDVRCKLYERKNYENQYIKKVKCRGRFFFPEETMSPGLILLVIKYFNSDFSSLFWQVLRQFFFHKKSSNFKREEYFLSNMQINMVPECDSNLALLVSCESTRNFLSFLSSRIIHDTWWLSSPLRT